MAAVVNCRTLFVHLICWALFLAEDNAGSNSAAKIAMIAITTSKLD